MSSNCVEPSAEILGKGGAAHLVSVPVLEEPVLANSPKAMTVRLKRDLHNTVVVRKDGPMTITKVQTPDLDILIRRASDDEFRIERNVKGQDRQLLQLVGGREGGESVSPCARKATRRISSYPQRKS